MKLVVTFRNFAKKPKSHAQCRIQTHAQCRIQTHTPAFTAAKYTVCWPPYKDHSNGPAKNGTHVQRAMSIWRLVHINFAVSSLPLLFRLTLLLRSSHSPVMMHAHCQHTTRIADSCWLWLPNMPEHCS